MRGVMPRRTLPRAGSLPYCSMSFEAAAANSSTPRKSRPLYFSSSPISGQYILHNTCCQKAEGSGRKAEGNKGKTLSVLPAFCFLPSAYCFPPSAFVTCLTGGESLKSGERGESQLLNLLPGSLFNFYVAPLFGARAAPDESPRLTKTLLSPPSHARGRAPGRPDGNSCGLLLDRADR